MTKRYSRQADIEAVRPHQETLTTAEISEQTGIPRRRVQTALRALGADKHRSARIARARNRKNKYRELLTPLLEEGLRSEDIATKLNLHVDTVTKAMRELGIDTRARGAQLRIDRADHGDPAMWQRCKCTICTQARKKYSRAKHERAVKQFDPTNAKHGTAAAANLKCPCDPCRNYRLTQTRERQTKTRKTAGDHYQPWDGKQIALVTSRRYTIAELAKLLGRTYASISNVRAALADPTNSSHQRYKAMLEDYQRTQHKPQ